MRVLTDILKRSQFDFTQRANQMLVVEVIRVGFYVAILAVTALLTIQQPHFVNLDLISPIYGLLACAFIVHLFHAWFFEQALRNWYVKAALFAFDTLLLTAIIYHSGVSQSIFLFLFLVNIVLCGFVFRTRGAIVLALWTSILFSILLLIGTEEIGQKIIFILGINNLAFFVVAVLSGLLSEQITTMGVELKERGRDIQVLQDYNKLIVDNVPTGILTMDAFGRIIHSNPSALKILNINENINGQPVAKWFPHFAEYFDRISQPPKLRPEVIPHRRILHVRKSEEEKRIYELICSPMREGEGQLSGFILLFEDNTELHQLENDVRQAEKMAAIGQLAAGIAHEIRNPLASISGSVELLFSMLRSQTDDETKLMNIVMKEIKRLNGLVGEFLDFVRPEGSPEAQININEVVINVADLLKMNKTLNHKVNLVTDLQSQKVILGNFNKLKQAILNIVINAYQAMEKNDGGKITVRTLDFPEKVVLKVRDEGVGMNETTVKKMFEPFHTTKKSGTGLGLAVTHKILEVHRAKVYVDSELGRGTEFVIEFPSNQEVVNSKIEMLTKDKNSTEILKRGRS
jgi:two-component system, NtrC family, sensor histidine kinase PilS